MEDYVPIQGPTVVEKPADYLNALLLFDNEDHTLANLLNVKINMNPDTIMSAYKISHPLKKTVELRIKTDASTNVSTVTQLAIDELIGELDEFKSEFNDATEN